MRQVSRPRFMCKYDADGCPHDGCGFAGHLDELGMSIGEKLRYGTDLIHRQGQIIRKLDRAVESKNQELESKNQELENMKKRAEFAEEQVRNLKHHLSVATKPPTPRMISLKRVVGEKRPAAEPAPVKKTLKRLAEITERPAKRKAIEKTVLPPPPSIAIPGANMPMPMPMQMPNGMQFMMVPIPMMPGNAAATS